MLGFTVVTLLALLVGQTGVPPPQSVSDIVAAVSRNVRQFQDLLPDFVCNERITSAIFESGKVRRQVIVESIFSAGPRQRTLRDVTAINGKAVRKNAKMPGLPLNIVGAFSSIRDLTFSPANLQFHDYGLDSTPDRSEKLVVRFETKRDQQEMKWLFGGERVLGRDAGEAWIDAATMQVIRIERNFLNLPRRLTRFTITGEYAPVTILEKQFWLPKIFRVDLTERDSRKTGQFIAEYTNCKKFAAEIRILP